MTDQELSISDATLIARLRSNIFGTGTTMLAADRIEELIAENKRLGQQCEGLMQAGMNNGQALIIAENKLAKAVELLEEIEARLKPISGFFFDTFPRREIKAILAEISSEAALNKGESHE
jgi:hypothetical protein